MNSINTVQSVAVFVDVQNIYYTTRQHFSRHFDYNRFWAQATGGRKVIAAVAFAIERGDPMQRQFQNVLRGIGFDVRLKPFLLRRDGSTKGDWDVGITLEVLEYAARADVVVLASGDGDFDLLVHKIRQDNRLAVEIYGVPQSTAGSLIEAATRFVPITEHLLLPVRP